MPLDPHAQKLIERGNKLFSDRLTLMSLWQEIADQFYVERADFTLRRWLGRDFAEHLMTSYPLLCRREFGDAIGAMLRPREKQWFQVSTTRQDREDQAALAWMQDKTQVMRRAMYDRVSGFHRAMKEGDHDYATFGQAVLSIEHDRKTASLFYNCHHLRDVVWAENYRRKVDTVHRKWKPTLTQLKERFKDKVAPEVNTKITDHPMQEIECRHIVMPSDQYDDSVDGKKIRQPFVSIYIDVEHGHIMEEVGSWNLIYVIPRWLTAAGLIGGSQYAFSPAVVAALPDGRLIQAMTRTLLEAGEKYSNPPLIATQQAVRSDVSLWAGGITWVDADYDERLGEALRPLTQNQHGFPIGVEMAQKLEDRLKSCFFLDKLSMPTPTNAREMTAFEVAQRVEQYIRQAMPIFEPIEQEYSAAVCEETFDLLMRGGAFGSPFDMPASLRGAQIQFRFESPLTKAIDSQLGQQLVQARQILAQVADLDPSLPHMLDGPTALRDALNGIGTPARWLRSEQAVAQAKISSDQQQAIAQAAQVAVPASQAAKNIADAAQSANAAGIGAPPSTPVGAPTRQ